MSEPEAAAYLNVNVRTLLRYRKKGVLAYQEVAGKTRPVIEYESAEIHRLKAEFDAKRVQSKKHSSASVAPVRRVTFGLTPERHKELETEAVRFGMSVGEYARRLVREGLESRFQAEVSELRRELQSVKADLLRSRQEFASALEVVLEYAGVDTAEAKQWVAENLRR